MVEDNIKMEIGNVYDVMVHVEPAGMLRERSMEFRIRR